MLGCTNNILSLCILTLHFVCHDALLLPKKMPVLKPLVDLRSDTITKPSPAMRKAMFDAEVGDDVYGEDPTVGKLEERTATLFKKEKSLFFPTGTMANLAASMAWCSSRGSEVIVGDQSHMYIYEQANLAQIGGISPRSVANSIDGTLDLDILAQAIRSTNIHFPTTELISLENTHNLCGGRVLSTEYTESVGALARRAGIPLHLDGARIWNAAAASGASVASLTAAADSVSACLSKGLGAPAGTMLMGSAAFIAKARRIRKALGGGMRQVGVLAAAGLQALEDFDQGMLSADHRRARSIAQGLSEVSGLRVDPVDTNIVLVHIDGALAPSTIFAAKLQEQGVKVLPRGAHSMQIVTHRDLSEEDVPAVVAAFRSVAQALWGAAAATSATVLPALVLTGLMKPEFIPVNITAGPPNGGGSAVKNTTTTTAVAAASIKAPTALSVSSATAVISPAAVPVVVAQTENNVEIGVNKSMNTSNQGSKHDAPTKSSPSVPIVAPTAGSIASNTSNTSATAASTASGTSSGTSLGTSSGTSLVHYEEATIRGMSVSSDGFCVILQGTVSNRCVRVLVTPEDPMSDGLDQDEVESSEAVTLLQLLQGIDIESFLPKDALATKFSSTGPAGARVKYDLKAVLVNDAGKGRKFHGVLAGFPRVRPKPVAAPALEKKDEKEAATSRIADNVHHVNTSARSETTKNISAHGMPSGSLDSAVPSADMLHTNNHNTSTTTLSGFEREVPLDSAFYAIALALRHHVPIEVRSDLLQNEKVSFSEKEIPSFYPKLLAASVKAPTAAQGKDRTHMVERLKKRLTEALRQRNAEKIAQIQDQIASLGAVPPSAAPISTIKAPVATMVAVATPTVNATRPEESSLVKDSAAVSVEKPIGSLNSTQEAIAHSEGSVTVDEAALHVPHASHKTSPIQ